MVLFKPKPSLIASALTVRDTPTPQQPIHLMLAAQVATMATISLRMLPTNGSANLALRDATHAPVLQSAQNALSGISQQEMEVAMPVPQVAPLATTVQLARLAKLDTNFSPVEPVLDAQTTVSAAHSHPSVKSVRMGSI